MSVSTERALQRARRVARKVLVQAFYQLQMTEQPWQDIYTQHISDPDSHGLDREFFAEVLQAVAGSRSELDQQLARFSDIQPVHLDPLEHGILWMGFYELTQRVDIPYRVIISEAVELAKKFGATDGHKFINGVLDRAAKECRPGEI
jgi:transcription antitermination protein NusB